MRPWFVRLLLAGLFVSLAGLTVTGFPWDIIFFLCAIASVGVILLDCNDKFQQTISLSAISLAAIADFLPSLARRILGGASPITITADTTDFAHPTCIPTLFTQATPNLFVGDRVTFKIPDCLTSVSFPPIRDYLGELRRINIGEPTSQQASPSPEDAERLRLAACEYAFGDSEKNAPPVYPRPTEHIIRYPFPEPVTINAGDTLVAKFQIVYHADGSVSSAAATDYELDRLPGEAPVPQSAAYADPILTILNGWLAEAERMSQDEHQAIGGWLEKKLLSLKDKFIKNFWENFPYTPELVRDNRIRCLQQLIKKWQVRSACAADCGSAVPSPTDPWDHINGGSNKSG